MSGTEPSAYMKGGTWVEVRPYLSRELQLQAPQRFPSVLAGLAASTRDPRGSGWP